MVEAGGADTAEPPADDAPATGTLAGAGTGALAGAVVGGPAGAAIGGAVGALVGALAGMAVEHSVDAQAEDEYWREQHANRPYVPADRSYAEYGPAYRYGWEARSRVRDRSFEELEPELERGWVVYRGHSALEWREARPAARDAWDRIDAHVRRHR
jgi:phage tail tape-measure protein